MLSEQFTDRVQRLIKARLAERDRAFSMDLAVIKSDCARTGMSGSGNYYTQIHQAAERELKIRTAIVWTSMGRVHKILGNGRSSDLAEAFKAIVDEYCDSFRNELDQMLESKIKNQHLRTRLKLDRALEEVREMHHVEVDLYVDSLGAEGAQIDSRGGAYNFYGSVGVVQTGPGAIANTVQNLGGDDRDSILKALEQVRAVIESSHELAPQRAELIEIAEECKQIMSSATPNNSKLRAYFEVFATSVQGIASAGPAYQALQAAALALGIILP